MIAEQSGEEIAYADLCGTDSKGDSRENNGENCERDGEPMSLNKIKNLPRSHEVGQRAGVRGSFSPRGAAPLTTTLSP